VVHLKPDTWVIVDHIEADASARGKSLWTVSSEVQARRIGSDDAFELEASNGESARMAFLGSAGTSVRDYRGSRAPFAGWQVMRSVPRPAPAIMVDQPPGDAWTVVVLSTAGRSSSRFYTGGKIEMSAGGTPSAWTITLPVVAGQLKISRAEEQIVVELEGGTQDTTDTLVLAPAPEVTGELRSIRNAFERTAVAYPVFQERSTARVRVTAFIAGLVLAQEVVLLIVRRWRPRFLSLFRVLVPLWWIGVAAALQLVLLRSWEVFALP
jgi:hypothetical protein